MDRTVHIPLDLESRTQFRILETKLGEPLGKERALAAVFRLYRELGYAAERDRLGWLSESNAALLAGTVKNLMGGLDPVEVFAAGGGFLEAQEENGVGGWFCEMFARDNKHLSRDYVSIQRAGGLARAAKLKTAEAAEVAVKQTAMLQPEFFVRVREEDGESVPMTEAESRNTTMLIKLLDNCMGRRDRLNSEFTPGLIQEAYRVVTRYSEEEINGVVRHLLNNRDKPGVPRSTEQMLREFGDMVPDHV